MTDLKTPIFYAISPYGKSRNIDLDLITYLVFNGAKLNINSRSGTPLIAAVKSENKYNKNVIDHLISLGADINFRDETGQSPLSHAMCPVAIVQRPSDDNN